MRSPRKAAAASMGRASRDATRKLARQGRAALPRPVGPARMAVGEQRPVLQEVHQAATAATQTTTKNVLVAQAGQHHLLPATRNRLASGSEMTKAKAKKRTARLLDVPARLLRLLPPPRQPPRPRPTLPLSAALCTACAPASKPSTLASRTFSSRASDRRRLGLRLRGSEWMVRCWRWRGRGGMLC